MLCDNQGANAQNVFVTGHATSVYSAAYAINLYSSLSVMGHQPDENSKQFSKEELNVWNVEKLRKYLKAKIFERSYCYHR